MTVTLLTPISALTGSTEGVMDANGHSSYFQAECCNLRRLAAVSSQTGPLTRAQDRKADVTPGFRYRRDCVRINACAACVMMGRKRTWTPELSDMWGICHLQSHAGMCRRRAKGRPRLSHSHRSSPSHFYTQPVLHHCSQSRPQQAFIW